MPSHPDRVRRNNPEMNCKHLYALVGFDIAPFINSDGTRTIIGVCVYCGKEEKYTQTQEGFLKKLIQ